MMRKITHGGLKKTIKDYLSAQGCLVIDHYNGAIRGQRGWFAQPNKGTSDIIALSVNGVFIGIEVKCGKDTPSPAQEDFLKRVNANEGVGIVARCLEDVEKLFFTEGEETPNPAALKCVPQN